MSQSISIISALPKFLRLHSAVFSFFSVVNFVKSLLALWDKIIREFDIQGQGI